MPSSRSPSGLRLAADIGGTFTDIAVFDDTTGKLTFGKVLTTPQRLVEGINAGVGKAGSDYAATSLFLHGSTIAINTMLERTAAGWKIKCRTLRPLDGSEPARQILRQALKSYESA